jgi:hypothetical protein
MSYQNTQHRSGLMNLIAEFVVKLLNEDKNTKSSISVTDHKNFIVINGQTNSSKIFNVNELRNNFTNEMLDLTSLYDISSLNVIDLIEYKTETIDKPKSMSFIFHNSSLPRYEQELINKVKELDRMDYSSVMSSEFGITTDIPLNNSYTKPYQSLFPYGYSLKDWKGIYLYLEYVSLNTFPVIKSNSIKFEIDSDLNFSVISDSLYDNQTIESMIKDVFDFNIDKFLSEIGDFQMTKDCLLFIDRPWLVKNKVRDSIIF